jgi:hypothetical protein
MKINKQDILNSICYTELVYKRINKKLNINYSKKQIEDYLFKILKDTDAIFFSKKGKNIYVRSLENRIIITINTNTFRIITVDRIKV